MKCDGYLRKVYIKSGKVVVLKWLASKQHPMDRIDQKTENGKK
jgi:hypothetical protein